ncbi:hypothetical protein VB773_12220 [Haloarculaceae archaeon H-GB2-1]|nr:hypothetical protein [Haloarculaceae archaeon H-GB1-1]MEA5386720.1 hypothetical protein [Haloarculaceae archaeon H-GB11]MEA5408246.1 hypothetical protein [Haloarculaceae archaeon H-GB2-1]
MSDEDFAWQLESRLTSHGVYVTELDEMDDGYDLTYESIAADEGAVPHREIGRVVNVFLDLHGDDWRGARIEATVLDLEGERKGTWHVEASWLGELTDDEISEEEFSARVLDTI